MKLTPGRLRRRYCINFIPVTHVAQNIPIYQKPGKYTDLSEARCIVQKSKAFARQAILRPIISETLGERINNKIEVNASTFSWARTILQIFSFINLKFASFAITC